ncbi:histone-lysine N-methyltransferase PR-Set7 isoform X2 [Teleopsis dalmanni]|uniref:histone-lysine N-methyltransferase PR-Set7 isoform X2 n=1 Tax=Teleopsis dalmanni TaxID=139649 RepID=UPI0018CF0923|nr:histone-lysine N-methyltransferase PR-Set7 isoform X2 [Teleopsis dalmanni]
MVRRRTTRANKVTAVGNAIVANGFVANGVSVVVANGNLLEDQYFASPKRKDCKIDNGLLDAPNVPSAVLVPTYKEREQNVGQNANVGNNSKTKSERGGIVGKTIGVPLATRSQTRTIENFFKAKTAAKSAPILETEEKKTINNCNLIAKNCPLPRNEVNSSPEIVLPNDIDYEDLQSSPHMPFTHISTDIFFDLSEDTNDTDNTELSEETLPCINGASFISHRSQRDSHSSRSSITDNIFLQEPVLTLNVDKSPNQASSIKINKSIELEPIFSSPPTITAAALNGRFNQIVSLNGSPGKRDSFGFESVPMNGFAHESLLDNKNVSLTEAGATQTRRRKPATPHRIVCPSPIKSAARVISPAHPAVIPPANRKSATTKEQLSPRKTQRHLVSATSKTRRRLNQHKEQTPYNIQTTDLAPLQNGYKQHNHITADTKSVTTVPDDDDPDQEFENLDLVESSCCAPLNGLNSATTKTVLNSAKHPTAQQNSTNYNNNNKLNQATKTQAKPKTNGTHKAQPKIKNQWPLPLAATNGNRELKEFFPVRRSVRKTKTAVKEEIMRNMEQAILEERADGLKIAHFEGKGRGVIADRRFKRNEFVVEYIGDLIDMNEASEREKRYALDENAGCYMYYFKHKNQQYCIDATADSGKLGRLVNHSRNGNLSTKVVVVKQRPHLILLAKDDIEEGEELTYDYGDRSKESLLHHPWLAF